MSVPEPAASAAPSSAPLALDGLACEIDLLDAVLVFHLGDAHLHALWVRPDGGVRADEVVTTLRDAYRVGQFASKRLAGASSPRAEAPAPLLTLELPQRTALLRRIRAHVVACIFDAAMPLGMARLIAGQLALALDPELPLTPEAGESVKGRAVVPVPAAESVLRPVSGRHLASPPDPPPPAQPASAVLPSPVITRTLGEESSPHTLAFGSALPRRSRPPPELDRVGRLLAYLEAHAPEPHVVRHRLALRAGLTLAALDRPEALGPEAIVLIETAVQDILGIDRAELRRIA